MVTLKGKYLNAVTDFADSMQIEKWNEVSLNPQYQHLVKTIAGIHSKLLTEGNARTIVLGELIACVKHVRHLAGKGQEANNEEFRADLSARITAYVESLPRRYVLRIELPEFPYLGEYSLAISERIRLTSAKRKFDGQTNALANLASGLRIGGPEQSTYLEIDAEGYGNESPDSPATADAISLAKQCVFLLTAYGIFERSYRITRSRAVLISDTPSSQGQVRLTESIAQSFGNLYPSEEKWVIYDEDDRNRKRQTLLAYQGRPPKTEAEKIEALHQALKKISIVFERCDHADFPSIAAAIEWYQDSMFADNQTFAYLAACIGLEALLGSDGHIDNMTRRLADRYGFMMGKSRSERATLSAEYENVLNLRGKLVHARQARLSGDDQKTLRTAQEMLVNVIWRELQQMLKDNQTS